jgi:hypothetical protein
MELNRDDNATAPGVCYKQLGSLESSLELYFDDVLFGVP